jgi:methylenetetrahydrofolate dehydrogenase (NADP+) / methenyltetrahydrofolate cyclohydrolase
MAVNIINGILVADHVRTEVMEDVQYLVSKGQRPPKLMVVIVGSDPASQIYVRAKTSACTKVGIESETMRLPDTISEKELREIIRRLNEDPGVDGILVQLPLPAHIHPLTVIETIDPRKDVDGFHPMNVGRLTIGQPTFKSCTPAGVLELLRYYSIPTKGKHAVVVGASNIVGSPMAIMLSRENETGKATTTICHKYTKDLTKHTIDADILVVAVGLPRLITGHMVKEGAVVVDVGMNRIPDPSSEKGYKLVGDCEYESVAAKASWITPVPGGVGPMTVAMLMKNTLLAAKNSIYPE